MELFLQLRSADRDEADGVLRTAKDLNARLQNWGTLLHNILNFYQEMLDSVVVMKLPDILSIAKDPLKDASLSAIQRLLLLLLGCAVQCVQKESYINVIKTLPYKVQEALVSQIRQVI
ncbi:hypothetical protein CAPTEDRAFT_94273 [Capitella teleta]|uniref:HOOK N-terminal domain-containing protein n=1 Tax=Capitella teleta TaxID=283909 RepID=R7U590_CAPTE|nr:hypothetical protein CAPTEDRAFT_94273 [Capitella teleta]|eukprot:ELU01144.1 hypothetical protein CAPTEDRAFT_94273 [Capitella teleta]